MKKSKQSKNKSIVLNKSTILNLSGDNTKVKLDSLGNVELKYVSYSDTQKIAKLLPEKTSDEKFVLKVLFQQLIKPEIDFGEFEKIPEKELEKLAKVFVKKESYIFKHFQNTGEFLKDFRQALQIHHDNEIEELRKTFEPIAKFIQSTLKAFENNYGPIIQQTFSSSYIKDTMYQFSAVAEGFRKTQLQFTESIKPIIEQYNATARILAESIKPQIEIWQRWTEQNQPVFRNIVEQWGNFQRKYKITEEKAVSVLQKYKWFISPSMPIDFIFEVVQLGGKKAGKTKQ